MKKRKIQLSYLECEGIEELSEPDQRLLQFARSAAEKAYAPYSDFRVGAAVLLVNGEIIKGNNQENAAYPSGLCAERIALFYAGANFPGVAVQAIAISANTNISTIKTIKPCGACCQVMAEYENLAQLPLKVLLDGKRSILLIEGVRNILPLAFSK